jgi:hypothetical protein
MRKIEETVWGKRIQAAKDRGGFIYEDRRLAEGWVTCACGELDGIERNDLSKVPLDYKLAVLGNRFAHKVNNNLMDDAMDTLIEIETRAVHVSQWDHSFTRKVADRAAAFSDKAFGPPAYRGPKGPLLHLAKEVTEAMADPCDINEYADCLLLILDASRRAGFSAMQVMEAADRKITVNEGRTWPDWKDQPGDVALEHDRTQD